MKLNRKRGWLFLPYGCVLGTACVAWGLMNHEIELAFFAFFMVVLLCIVGGAASNE